jgi:hypothetical protein
LKLRPKINAVCELSDDDKSVKQWSRRKDA